jgi:hypothetical protein
MIATNYTSFLICSSMDIHIVHTIQYSTVVYVFFAGRDDACVKTDVVLLSIRSGFAQICT